MSLAQIGAVTGRRIRPNYVEAINAQVPYVPALKSAQRSDELTRRGLDLDERAMTQDYNLSLEELEQAKKQNKIANMLGIANLGLKTGLGIYGESKTPNPVVESAGKVAGTEGYVAGNMMPDDLSMAAKPSFFSAEGAGNLGNWKDAALDWSHLATAGLGTMAAKTIGKNKSNTTKALIGAGTSGLAQAVISGGDPFKTVVSAVLGGLGGRFL